MLILGQQVSLGVEPKLFRPELSKFIEDVSHCTFVADMGHRRDAINPNLSANPDLLIRNGKPRPHHISLFEHFHPVMLLYQHFDQLEFSPRSARVDFVLFALLVRPILVPMGALLYLLFFLNLFLGLFLSFRAHTFGTYTFRIHSFIIL